MDMNMKEYVNWKMSHDIKYGEAEGYPLVLEDCRKNKDLKNLQIYGNSVQEGEPTPENPIGIESVGELTTKNLLDVESVYPDYVNDEGGITYTNLDVPTIYKNPIKLDCKENTAYTFSFDYSISTVNNNSITMGVGYTDGTGDYLWVSSNTTGNRNGKRSITSNKNKTVNQFTLSYATSNETMNVKLTNMQIEEGETATEYEPYHKYKIPITARGKNILDMSKQTVSQGYYNDTSGTINSSNNNLIRISPIAVNPSTKYTISIGTVNSNLVLYTVWFHYGSGETHGIKKISTGKRLKATFTTPENCNYICVSMHSSSGAKPTDLKWAMLELGECDEIYEPYIEPQTFNIYLDEPLRRDRDAIDVIDFEKGAVLRRVVERTYDGTEDWQKYGSYEHTFTISFPLRTASIPDGYAKVSHYKGGGTTRLDTDGYGITGSSWSGLFVDYRFSTVDEFKAFLAEQATAGTPLTTVNGVYEWYNDGKPKEEPIKLPELPKPQSKTMIYEVDTNILPSNMSAKYIKKY